MNTLELRHVELTSRRGYFADAVELADDAATRVTDPRLGALADLDLVYRTLCAVLYNFVPTSGHPGGSISSGRIVEGLLYGSMMYDLGDPDDPSADLIVYAAGHKAMGLYAMWALRNEIMRQHDLSLLPVAVGKQLRLEDLLGFRRNPTQNTPLFRKFTAKALDGHPAPTVPFVPLATGASGVGVASAVGLGIAARDRFGPNAPFVHIIEGEGGLTPGRVQEAMAAAATAQVNNLVLHVDWNQASIDTDRVCGESGKPGEYVQWNPVELAALHDWNVIQVPDGFDFDQILSAQKSAAARSNDQPTCIVYRTVKGWKYGIEGKGSHGAGHKFCSDEFSAALKPFEERFGIAFPRFTGDKSDQAVEQLFFGHLLCVREVLAGHGEIVTPLGERLEEARDTLRASGRRPRVDAPNVEGLYQFTPRSIPPGIVVAPGGSDTLREALGRVLNHLNKASGGAIIAAAADLYGSTSIRKANDGFPGGFWNAASNRLSRLLAVGGICEDAMGGVISGISTFGGAIGVASSYGAFIAALQHVAARLHCIGQQGAHDYDGRPHRPMMIVCAHAGLKTGEDGPTHADPQALQLLQDNFPRGHMITLTPWDPNETWPLIVAALNRRPSVIAPFVTRPGEKVVDRQKLGLPPVEAAVKGVYPVRQARPDRPRHGTVIVQGAGEMNAFVQQVLPRIDSAGLNLNVFYVASAELFDLLRDDEQEAILPTALCREAMGITGFTLATMHRWIGPGAGRRWSLHPFRGGRFPGSGMAERVMLEASLDGEAQWQAVSAYAQEMAEATDPCR